MFVIPKMILIGEIEINSSKLSTSDSLQDSQKNKFSKRTFFLQRLSVTFFWQTTDIVIYFSKTLFIYLIINVVCLDIKQKVNGG